MARTNGVRSRQNFPPSRPLDSTAPAECRYTPLIPRSPSNIFMLRDVSAFCTRPTHLRVVRLHHFGNSFATMEPQAKVPKLSDNNNNNNNGHSKVLSLASQSLRVKKLSENAIVPSRGSALAAGYDLSSAYDTVVPARGKALVKTDLSIAIPEGTYARVAPRSGLAWKNSIDVGAGVIDADYRGPVGVILFNHADSDFEIKAGDRIAQLILELIVTPDVVQVDDLDATVRGEGGFGSTGVSLVVES